MRSSILHLHHDHDQFRRTLSLIHNDVASQELSTPGGQAWQANKYNHQYMLFSKRADYWIAIKLYGEFEQDLGVMHTPQA
jgi:hypothetical protein